MPARTVQPRNGDSSYLSLASASQTNLPLTTDDVIDAIGRRVLALTQTGRCAIFLRQRDGSYSCPWYTGLSTGYVQSILAETAHSFGKDYFFLSRPGPLIITDTGKSLVTTALSALAREEGYRAVHFWPVETKGSIVAAVGCYYNKPHTPTKTESKAITAYLAQVANDLENAVPRVEPRPAVVLNGLYDLSRQLVANDSLEVQLQSFAQSTVEIVQVSFCRILVQESHGVYRCQAVYPERSSGLPIQTDNQGVELLLRRVATTKSPFVLHRSDITLNYELRMALELDLAHSLCFIPLHLDTENLGLLVLGEERQNQRFSSDKIRVANTIADLVASVVHRERLYHRLEESYLETILALTRTLEARDPYTAGHSKRLEDLVEKVGKRLGCGPVRLQSLRWAALLHDIGKIGVPDHVLTRPGPLSSEEWESMKKHPQIGADIITPVSSLAHVAPFVLAHHEHFDGSGYPYGLKGDEIPLEARILSVVDAFCAMTDGRIYRAAKTHAQATEELRRCSGTHFDPRVVDTFLNILEHE